MRRRCRLQNLKVHPVDPNTGCINFSGCTNKAGYGSIKVGEKPVLAHRFFYEKYKGAILGDLCVLHICNNRKCINPEHLYLGTHKQNMKDKDKAGHYSSPVLDSITEEQSKILTNCLYTIRAKAELTGLSRGTVCRAMELALHRKRNAPTRPPTSLELLLAKTKLGSSWGTMKEYK